MMTVLSSQMSLLLLLFLSVTTIFHKSTSTNDHRLVRCNEKDEETLLIFRKGITDSSDGKISTWSTEKDCCAWEGVRCNNSTGRVIVLDLSAQGLEGEINFSILQLEFLGYLDLSNNEFTEINIPSTQHNITHASNLFYLDLSQSPGQLDGDVLHMDNLDWLYPLSSLESLKLNGIDLHKETNWLHAVATLPSLFELHLSDCKLNNFIINPSIEYMNFSSLETLILRYNNFTSQLPNWLFNITKDLTYLDLSSNNIHGEIPSSLLYLQNLRYLDLSYNQLEGSIPNGIGQLENIQHLDIYKNMLSGSVHSTVGNLSSLRYLSIGYNNFSGEISENTFSKLSNLYSLDLRGLNLVFQFDLDWVPPFQLQDLLLSHTNQGPNFPSWIYTQKSLEWLALSSSRISLVDRNKFPSLVERIADFLSLSNNSLIGDISNLTLKCQYIYLHHNNFTGRLPNLSSPTTQFIDLSYNFFSGSIPYSWKNLKNLFHINLWSNRLSGEVLAHLSYWKQLRTMNLGENEFSGTIPIKITQRLAVFVLRANQFEGTIPPQIFNLNHLVHLDLADNKLSGSIPKCVYNLTVMINLTRIFPTIAAVELFTKGQKYYVPQIHSDRKTIDLSRNNLSGEVPLELFRLIQVQTLNLSHNSLIGTIPKTIGDMKNIESLDLSNNKLCGEIPQSMAFLNFLEYLNLSYNSFNGKIPIGTQLQSFDASSFIGNPKLCGAPLNNCTTGQENPKNATLSIENEDGDSIRESLYLGMGVGFAVGFLGICGSVFLNEKWRHAYYRFLDGVSDKFYVTLMVKLNSFRRN